MRVISCNPGFSLQIFQGKFDREIDPVTGQSYSVTLVEPLVANFIAGADGAGITPRELSLALAQWDNFFRGKPDEVLGNPAPYISVYDTEAQAFLLDWSDEYHQKVIDRILFLAPDRTDRMLVIEDIKAAKPFPAYDSKTPEDVLAFLDWSEGDPNLYIAYEEENQKRPELVTALHERLVAVESGEVIASVTA